jgi:hypothetical protein
MEIWPYVQAMCSGVFPKESTFFSEGSSSFPFPSPFKEAALSSRFSDNGKKNHCNKL